MNETWLRIKGRIGASKGLAIVVGIFILVLGSDLINNAIRSFTNLSGVQNVSVSQLAGKQIGTNRYVAVSGIAAYELSYKETNNEATVGIVFPLIDSNTHTVVFVHTKQIELANQADKQVTVTGITETTPAELQTIITRDMADINTAGYQANADLYILQDEKPGDPILMLLLAGGVGLVLALAVATLFFPSTVFQAQPMQPAAQVAEGKIAIRLSGRLWQVKTLTPTLEFSHGSRNFQNSVANVFTSNEGWLGLFIRFVQTHRMYGIQVSKNTTDWAVIVSPAQVLSIEPGKIYSWRDRWAVSIRYRDSADKENSLIVSFDHNGAQAQFMEFLRSKNYPVGGLASSYNQFTWNV